MLIKKTKLNYGQFLLHNREVCKKYDEKFYLIFRVRLSKYFNNLFGFDIIKFDDEIIKSGDGCMEDTVKKKYGTDGVRIIRLILANELKTHAYKVKK